MMKKLLTILFCLGALALYSCEDASEEVYMDIDSKVVNGDFDSDSATNGE